MVDYRNILNRNFLCGIRSINIGGGLDPTICVEL